MPISFVKAVVVTITNNPIGPTAMSCAKKEGVVPYFVGLIPEMVYYSLFTRGEMKNSVFYVSRTITVRCAPRPATIGI
jgi:hypothetical protein